MKSFFLWWHDNFKRPSTWIGLLCLFIGYMIFQDKGLLHQLLSNIVNNSEFISMLVGLISGGFFGYKKHTVDK